MLPAAEAVGAATLQKPLTAEALLFLLAEEGHGPEDVGETSPFYSRAPRL